MMGFEKNGWRKKRFVSLRVKMLSYFTLLLVAIMGLVIVVLPNVVNNYFLTAKQNDIVKVRDILDEVLTKGSFLTDAETRNILEIAARTSDICIWICTEKDEKISIHSFGGTTNDSDAFNENDGNVMIQSVEMKRIRQVLYENYNGYIVNAFSSAFSGQTISLGYSQDYQINSDVEDSNGNLIPYPTVGKAAIFIHIAMDDIASTADSMTRLLFLAMIVVGLASWCMVFFMSNNIIDPVRNLQKAAGRIMKGDFSQTIEVEHNDEIGQLTQSFNEMTKELKELDTLQSDFIANISHDFRSPLTSIKGYLEAMMDGTIPPEQYSKYMQIVLDETNRLTKMTNNILDLTKMENGQIELNRTNFEVNDTIIKLALGLEQRVEEKNIEMDFQFLQEKMFVHADKDLIQRVIYNLMDNALKFSSQGGKITIETSVVGKKALISVTDTGIGISEESLPYVFERFHKGDRSRGKDKKGTGLGLTIAKQIIVTHQEDISVHSKMGEGTTFQFTLPLAYRYNLVEKR